MERNTSEGSELSLKYWRWHENGCGILEYKVLASLSPQVVLRLTQLSIPTHAQLQSHRLKFIKYFRE
jgi:hypothetical protein